MSEPYYGEWREAVVTAKVQYLYRFRTKICQDYDNDRLAADAPAGVGAALLRLGEAKGMSESNAAYQLVLVGETLDVDHVRFIPPEDPATKQGHE